MTSICLDQSPCYDHYLFGSAGYTVRIIICLDQLPCYDHYLFGSVGYIVMIIICLDQLVILL